MVEKGRSAEETRPAIAPQMVQADGRDLQGNGRMRNGQIGIRVRLPHGWRSTFLECFLNVFKLSLMIHV
jgi:hypothetical protein